LGLFLTKDLKIPEFRNIAGDARMKVSEMKKGQTIIMEGVLYVIVDYQHVKLGKGGAVYQTKLKNLVDGGIRDIRFRAEENVEDAFLEKRNFEYLYSSGSEHHFMDLESYDQITLDDDAFGEGKQYLLPNSQIQISMYQEKPVVVTLPNTVDLTVTDTAPEIKGATATNQYKPATLETGLEVQVPPFIKLGEKIRVDTRTGEYVTRVKE
jgi:elongation factor P